MSTTNISVALRLRPLNEAKKEKWAGGLEFGTKVITLGDKTYKPNATLDATSSNADVLDFCRPALEAVSEGHNGTILVYGQTGTGKTHTMFGSSPQDTSGVTFQATGALLDHVEQSNAEGHRVSTVKMSVVEIYNEKLTDLLDPQRTKPLIVVNSTMDSKKIAVTTLDAAHSLVRKAVAKRHIARTAMNDNSSRSHLVVQLEVSDVLFEITPTTTSAQVSNLFLVDLAGSESIKKSGVCGTEAHEAGQINKSLLVLKRVIKALSEEEAGVSTTSAGRGTRTGSISPHPTAAHVPYRESKLLQVLQDSIGGTAKTCLVACISPNSSDIDETKNTLEYAAMASTVRNTLLMDKPKMRKLALEMEHGKLMNRLSMQVEERQTVTMEKAEYQELLDARRCLEQQREENHQMAEFLRLRTNIETLHCREGEVIASVARRQREENLAAIANGNAGHKKLKAHLVDVAGAVKTKLAASYREQNILAAKDKVRFLAAIQSGTPLDADAMKVQGQHLVDEWSSQNKAGRDCFHAEAEILQKSGETVDVKLERRLDDLDTFVEQHQATQEARVKSLHTELVQMKVAQSATIKQQWTEMKAPLSAAALDADRKVAPLLEAFQGWQADLPTRDAAKIAALVQVGTDTADRHICKAEANLDANVTQLELSVLEFHVSNNLHHHPPSPALAMPSSSPSSSQPQQCHPPLPVSPGNTKKEVIGQQGIPVVRRALFDVASSQSNNLAHHQQLPNAGGLKRPRSHSANPIENNNDDVGQ